MVGNPWSDGLRIALAHGPSARSDPRRGLEPPARARRAAQPLALPVALGFDVRGLLVLTKNRLSMSICPRWPRLPMTSRVRCSRLVQRWRSRVGIRSSSAELGDLYATLTVERFDGAGLVADHATEVGRVELLDLLIRR